MPGVSTEMKEQLGKNVETLKAAIGKIDIAARTFHTLANREPTAQHEITDIKAKLTDLTRRQTNLAVGGTDDSRYNTLRDEIRDANAAAPKLEKKIEAETETFKETGWMDSIQDTAGHHVDLGHFDTTFKGVLHKIIVDHGRNDHGDTQLTDGTHCKHWVSGSERIFGNYVNGHLVFIGHGRHTGSGNSQYNVTLIRGGTTKATTA